MNRLLRISALVVCLIGLAQAEIFQAGTTYGTIQHNGSCGRMIGVDPQGGIHVVWMKNMSSILSGNRHVMYNYWNPASRIWLDDTGAGMSVTTDSRSGYASLAMRTDGWCIPAFHAVRGVDEPHAAASMDFARGMGAFAFSIPGFYNDNGTQVHSGWPKIAADINGNVHMISEELPMPVSGPARLFYSYGLVTFDDSGFGQAINWQAQNGQTLQRFDSSQIIAHDIACSRQTPRIARAWIRPGNGVANDSSGYNFDVFVQTSEDAGLNWQPSINITHFVQPDASCDNPIFNESCCNRDTLRAFNDLSLIFDGGDNLNVAFTTVSYHAWHDGQWSPTVKPHQAAIWHWYEGQPQITQIAALSLRDDQITTEHRLPPRHAVLERPSLSLDTTHNRLYCAYLQYDTADYSDMGYMNADVFVAYHDQNVAGWYRGTNVTNSHPEMIPAPAGANTNEQDPSLADFVTADTLHLFYEFLRGAEPNPEMAALSPMRYQRVATAEIPPVFQNPVILIHAGSDPCNTAVTDENFILPPSSFILSAFPNPLNAMTMIRYELPSSGPIELGIFDVLGRNVKTLYSGFQTAGSYDIQLDGTALVTGVYFVRLTAGGHQTEQKILLLK